MRMLSGFPLLELYLEPVLIACLAVATGPFRNEVTNLLVVNTLDTSCFRDYILSSLFLLQFLTNQIPSLHRVTSNLYRMTPSLS